MITPLRDRLKHSLLPKPSAFDLGARKIGVYKPSLQFNLLDNENRRDVVHWLSSYVS